MLARRVSECMPSPKIRLLLVSQMPGSHIAESLGMEALAARHCRSSS